MDTRRDDHPYPTLMWGIAIIGVVLLGGIIILYLAGSMINAILYRDGDDESQYKPNITEEHKILVADLANRVGPIVRGKDYDQETITELVRGHHLFDSELYSYFATLLEKGTLTPKTLLDKLSGEDLE